MSDVPPSAPFADEEAQFKVLIIGKTGDGKSTLTNFLIGSDARTSFALKSCTVEGTTYRGRFRNTDVVIDIVDTPGMMDSSEGNLGILKKFKEALLQMQDGINAVIFTQGLNAIRLDESMQLMLKMLDKVFPEQEFWERSAVVFTHWDTLAADRRQPYLDKWMSEMPVELKEVNCRLNFNNMFCFKGQEDPGALDGMLSWIGSHNKFVPHIVTDVASGKEDELMGIVADLQKQLIEMQLRHEKALNELTDQMRSDRQDALQKQLEMQNEFVRALEAKDQKYADSMERMMSEQRAALEAANNRPVEQVSKKKSSCFLPTAHVIEQDRGVIEARQVNIGDQLLGYDVDKQQVTFSEVYFLACDYAKRHMLAITATNRESGERQQLVLTGDHLVRVAEKQQEEDNNNNNNNRHGQRSECFVEAHDLRCGVDELLLWNADSEQIVKYVVERMDAISSPQPQCFILTCSHTLFVDNTLISCFEKNHEWYVKVTSVLRVLYRSVLPLNVMKALWFRDSVVALDNVLSAVTNVNPLLPKHYYSSLSNFWAKRSPSKYLNWFSSSPPAV